MIDLLDYTPPVMLITLDELKTQLKDKLGKIVLYGYGTSSFFDILESMHSCNIFPIAYSDTDKNKWNIIYKDKKVIAPNEIRSIYGDDVLIITCFLLHLEERMRDVNTLLNAYGIYDIRHVSYFMCCPELFKCLHGKRNHFDLFINMSDEQKFGINQSYELLADEESKRLYKEIIGFRSFPVLNKPLINGAVDYFSFNYFLQYENEIFVDCGAYNGDTLKDFLNHYKEKFEQYIAFEPDPLNFNQLQEYVKNISYKDKIKLYQAAASDKNDLLRLESNNYTSSSITSTGTEVIKAVTIDEVLSDIHVTFIKLDVEGFEKNILLGAKNVISNYRPVLAVSAYHMLDDIWQLPILINKLCNNYKIFFEAMNSFVDYILIAVPIERLKIDIRN